MAMKNTHYTLRVVLLSVLLFHAPQTLQERIERNADDIPNADLLEDGRKSIGVRKMLSAKDVFARRAQFSKDEDTKFESFSNTKTVAPSYVEGTATSVEAKTLVLKGSGTSTIVSSFSSLSGASSTDETSSQNRRLSSSSSSGSSKSSTWRTGDGTTTTSWSSSSYSSIRSASSSERSLTSTTVPLDSRTRKDLPEYVPRLTTALGESPIPRREEPTEDPVSKKETVESPTTQEGTVQVPPSEAEAHRMPPPMTPSTSVSPSTSPSEVEELAEGPEESPSVPPELGSWSDDDESENSFVRGIAVLAILVLLIVLAVLFLIRCCVCRSRNRVGYVALL